MRLRSLLVDHAEAARMRDIPVASWDRLNAAGKTPRPIRLGGGRLRWRRSDLESWIGHGCPDRKTFEALYD